MTRCKEDSCRQEERYLNGNIGERLRPLAVQLAALRQELIAVHATKRLLQDVLRGGSHHRPFHLRRPPNRSRAKVCKQRQEIRVHSPRKWATRQSHGKDTTVRTGSCAANTSLHPAFCESEGSIQDDDCTTIQGGLSQNSACSANAERPFHRRCNERETLQTIRWR